jgi:hypothetical protein
MEAALKEDAYTKKEPLIIERGIAQAQQRLVVALVGFFKIFLLHIRLHSIHRRLCQGGYITGAGREEPFGEHEKAPESCKQASWDLFGFAHHNFR